MRAFIVLIISFALSLFMWGTAMAKDKIFIDFEANTRQIFKKSSFANKASGELSFDLDWGAVGMSGKLSGGTFRKKDLWASDFAESIDWDAMQALLSLYDKSKELAEGPLYKCKITFDRGQTEFLYYFENAPIKSLSDIAKNDHGSYPLFSYRKHFSEELIEASGKGELRIGHQALIEVLLPKGVEVPEHHMEFYAINDFIGDFYNGGLNQYFARTITWDSAQYNRAELYPRLSAALTRLGRDDVKNMFDEAIALYAHYNEHVEKGRKAMGIPAVPKQEESDIGSRFWDVVDELEQEVESYIKANKSEFAYH